MEQKKMILPNMLSWRLLFMLLGLLLAGCANPAVTQPAEEPTPQVSEGLPEEVLQAIAARIGVESEGVEVRDARLVDWPNACLGFPGADEMCAEVITPGYTGTLFLGKAKYEFRTDLNGSQVRLIPEALDAARKYLADQLQVEVDLVNWVDIKTVEWPDACLGIPREDVSCAQVVTPGYRVVLDVAGNTYVLRTNLTGSVVVLEVGTN